jgi:hypothetical protein
LGADEPLRIVNIKKSIASQLDITAGVKHDGPSVKWESIWEGESTSFTVYEVKLFLTSFLKMVSAEKLSFNYE